MKIRRYYEVQSFVTVTTGRVLKDLNSGHLLRRKSQRINAVKLTQLVVIQLINRFHAFMLPGSTQCQHKTAQINTVLNQVNPVHVFTNSCPKNNFNITLPSILTSLVQPVLAALIISEMWRRVVDQKLRHILSGYRTSHWQIRLCSWSPPWEPHTCL
jgi:hypothetical protein